MSEARLLAIFDLGWYAPTFDIFEFALNARVWAHRHGIPRVKLVILKRRFSGALRRQPQLPHEYDFRLHDILLGASSLFAIDDVELTSDLARTTAAAEADRDHVFPPGWSAQLAPQKLSQHRYYLEQFVRDHLAADGQLPGIRIPPTAFKKVAALLGALPKPWISITLRRTPYLELRNSIPAAWHAVRQHFERQGATVVFIPDIESPNDFSAATPLAMMAVANVAYRAALYDACDLNLAVVNGSIAPSLYNPCAVHVITKFGTAGTNASAQRMLEVFGMQPGSPLFYRVPWQRALWESDDDAERLIMEGQQMLEFGDALRKTIRATPFACDPWEKPDGTLRGLWDGIRPGMSATQIGQAFASRTGVLENIAQLKQSSPFSCKPWMAEAENLFGLGEREAALRCAKLAIQLDGRYRRPYVIAAECLKASGQTALADRYVATAQSLPGKK